MIVRNEPAELCRCTALHLHESERLFDLADLDAHYEHKQTSAGTDIYFDRFRNDGNKWDSHSPEATQLCRLFRVLKRGEQVRRAYMVRKRQRGCRLVIYHESAKAVRDTLQTVVGRQWRDYVEVPSRSGDHAHVVVVKPAVVAKLRAAFARPERSVLVRDANDLTSKTQLNLNDKIAGVPFWAVKDMLRMSGYAALDADYVTAVFNLDPDHGQRVFNGLVQQGFLNGGDASPRGKSLATAKLSRRFDRKTAEALLAGVVERAREINADRDLVFYVAELRLYGSLLERPDGDFGDVDIAYTLSERPGIGDSVNASKARYRSSGRSGGNLLAMLGYGEAEVLARLKGRKLHLSLQPYAGGGGIENLGCATRVVFTAGAVAHASASDGE